nr:hypothetical protein [Geobacillus sp. C56-T3]
MSTERESRGRIIFHVDCNSFFASCEIARHPTLREKPVVVAGDPKERRGIVLAANYAAKQHFGIYTTMPLWEAKKRCLDLVVRPPDFAFYREMSRRMFQWLERFSPVLERASIDEGHDWPDANRSPAGRGPSYPVRAVGAAVHSSEHRHRPE